jgi:hypothetical protein
MPISRIVISVPNATVVLLDKLIEVRKDLACCLLVTCLLHFDGTFLVRVRFFECLSFICVTSPNNRDSKGKPDMEFWLHKSGRHYFNPKDSEFTFVNTVSKNKAGFMKRQIKDMEVTRSLYSKHN